jgi:DNA-binding MarR family transcriptional regulator
VSGSEPGRVAEQLERLVLALVRSRGPFLEVDERPLSPTQRLALAIAGDESPLRLGALADRMGTTDATASRTVDSLEAAGLLRRERDPSDRRGVLVVATREAVKLLAERRRRLVAALARGLAAMPEDDRARLVFLLEELNEVLEAPAPAARAVSGA